MCIAYQRAGIPGQRSQRGLRLTQRGGATTYFKASLVREPSLVGIEAFSPPIEAWASLEDSMVGRDARSQGRGGGNAHADGDTRGYSQVCGTESTGMRSGLAGRTSPVWTAMGKWRGRCRRWQNWTKPIRDGKTAIAGGMSRR